MKKITALIVVLALAALACTLPGAPIVDAAADLVATGIAQTLEAALTAGVTADLETPAATEADASAEPSQTLVPTNTGAPATNTPLPCNKVTFVADVTIPDGSDIPLNGAFTKTWRLRNDGSCTWDSNYKLVFKSGDQMGGPASKSLIGGSVAPGQTFEVSVNLTAPNSAGSYQGFWHIQEPGGGFFELSTGPFWVLIDAVGADLPDWPIFRLGDNGPEVYAIQYLLRHHGSAIAADGAYGPNTRLAVIQFQNDKGIAADGIVGPITWGELIKNMNVQQGANGDRVRAIQILLKVKYNYVSVVIDGNFGPITNDGVESFQNSVGLVVDGIVGPQTWQYLVGGHP
jgi:hypothetical protein